jgi:hypothetical protein
LGESSEDGERVWQTVGGWELLGATSPYGVMEEGDASLGESLEDGERV